jgi:hypothetical protein
VIRSGPTAGGGWTGWGGPAGDDAGALDGAVGAAGATCGVEGPLADVVGVAAGSVLAAGAAPCAALGAASTASDAASWIATARAIEPLGRDGRSGFALTVCLDG